VRPDDVARLEPLLASAGMSALADGDAWRKLSSLRQMYEPYVNSLAQFFALNLTPWVPDALMSDNWQTSDRGTVLPEAW
jgi:hypothetical protein